MDQSASLLLQLPTELLLHIFKLAWCGLPMGCAMQVCQRFRALALRVLNRELPPKDQAPRCYHCLCYVSRKIVWAGKNKQGHYLCDTCAALPMHNILPVTHLLKKFRLTRIDEGRYGDVLKKAYFQSNPHGRSTPSMRLIPYTCGMAAAALKYSPKLAQAIRDYDEEMLNPYVPACPTILAALTAVITAELKASKPRLNEQRRAEQRDGTVPDTTISKRHVSAVKAFAEAGIDGYLRRHDSISQIVQARVVAFVEATSAEATLEAAIAAGRRISKIPSLLAIVDGTRRYRCCEPDPTGFLLYAKAAFVHGDPPCATPEAFISAIKMLRQLHQTCTDTKHSIPEYLVGPYVSGKSSRLPVPAGPIARAAQAFLLNHDDDAAAETARLDAVKAALQVFAQRLQRARDLWTSIVGVEAPGIVPHSMRYSAMHNGSKYYVNLKFCWLLARAAHDHDTPVSLEALEQAAHKDAQAIALAKQVRQADVDALATVEPQIVAPPNERLRPYMEAAERDEPLRWMLDRERSKVFAVDASDEAWLLQWVPDLTAAGFTFAQVPKGRLRWSKMRRALYGFCDASQKRPVSRSAIPPHLWRHLTPFVPDVPSLPCSN